MIRSQIRVSSPEIVHAVLTHCFEQMEGNFSKVNPPVYKILQIEDRKIYLATPEKFLNTNFSYSAGETNNLIRVQQMEQMEDYSFALGEKVVFGGKLSYSKSLTRPIVINGKRISNLRVVALNHNGDSYLTNEGKTWLPQWLENETGISFNVEDIDVQVEMCDLNLEKGRTTCKKVKDGFLIRGEGVVVDSNKAKSLVYRSIGRAKSYGFGSVFVQTLAEGME